MSLSLPPPPNTQNISEKDGKVNWTWADWFQRLQRLLNELVPASGAQTAIQFEDEGSPLGSIGTVQAVNLVGPNIQATRAGDIVTITESAQAPVQYQDEGLNLGSAGTANLFNVVGSGAVLTRAGNALTLTVSSSGGAQAGIQFQDEGTNLGTPGTVDLVNFVGAQITAARVLNALTVTVAPQIFTPQAFVYTDAGGLLAATANPLNGQLLIGASGSIPLVGALTAGTGISITNSPGSITINATGGGAGSQVGIQFQDEGLNLGTSGTVDTLNAVGPNLIASRAGNVVTLTESAQAPIQFRDEGVALGTSGTALSLDVVGAGATLSRAGNALTLTVPGGGASGQVATQYQDEGVNLGTTGTANVFDVVGAGATLTRAGDTVTLTVPGAAAGQDAILFSDEGIPLGSSGTATSLDVVGAGAALSRVGNALTLTVPGSIGGQTAILFQDEGVPLGTPGTVDTLNVVGTGATLARVGNTATLTIPGSAASQTPIQYQDESINLGTAGTADTVNFTGPGIVASRVGNSVTVNVPNAGTGTVTSVGLVATPTGIFDVTGSPVTTNGNINLSLDNQSANTVLAGPDSGAAATPAFRALTAADIPVLDGFRNKIIGGDFGTNPWQRGVNFPNVAGYTADRWTYQASTAGQVTIAREPTGNVVPLTGRLVANNLVIVVTVVDASVAAGDFAFYGQIIEGYNFQSLAQRPMVFSFWHGHLNPGVYCVAFRNAGADRSFVAEYTQTVGNVYEYTSIVIPASPAAGTWNYTNGVGLNVSFALMAGTDFHTTPGVWQTGNFLATANQTNFLNAVNNTMRFILIQIESGIVATPFESRSFGEELELCQRYYEKSFALATAPANGLGAVPESYLGPQAGAPGPQYAPGVKFKTRKRAAPAVALYSIFLTSPPQLHSGGIGDWALTTVSLQGETGFAINGTAPGPQGAAVYGHWTADAEL